MTSFDIKTALQNIHLILTHHSGDCAGWIASVIELCDTDETALFRALNSKRMWGGAGSIANEALADNPGMNDLTWQSETREFRELMIELADHLKARDGENPDISSWKLAFSNWNQSEI